MLFILPSGIMRMTKDFMQYKKSIKIAATNGFRKKAVSQLITAF